MTRLEHMIRVSGAQWVGIQETDGVSLVLFRDPVSGTGCALKQDAVTPEAIDRKLKEARERFGIRP